MDNKVQLEVEEQRIKVEIKHDQQKIQLETEREERLVAESQRRDIFVNTMCQMLTKFTSKP